MTTEQYRQFEDYYNCVRVLDRQNDISANMSKYEHMRIAIELMRLNSKEQGQERLITVYRDMVDKMPDARAKEKPAGGAGEGQVSRDKVVTIAAMGAALSRMVIANKVVGIIGSDMIRLADEILKQANI